MSYIRDRAELLLLTQAKLRMELRKAEERVSIYQFLALTGWCGVVVLALSKYLP